MFITTMLKNWRPLFERVSIRDKVEEMLFRTASNSDTALMAHCIMPDHIHLIAGHVKGGPGISSFMQRFKSLVSHQLFPQEHGIWVPRFDDVVLKSDSVFETKLNYIHENAVRAGLAQKATDWKWSSARFWLLDETSNVLTKTWDWVDGVHREGMAPSIISGESNAG
jgi:putative transposase